MENGLSFLLKELGFIFVRVLTLRSNGQVTSMNICILQNAKQKLSSSTPFPVSKCAPSLRERKEWEELKRPAWTPLPIPSYREQRNSCKIQEKWTLPLEHSKSSYLSHPDLILPISLLEKIRRPPWLHRKPLDLAKKKDNVLVRQFSYSD